MPFAGAAWTFVTEYWRAARRRIGLRFIDFSSQEVVRAGLRRTKVASRSRLRAFAGPAVASASALLGGGDVPQSTPRPRVGPGSYLPSAGSTVGVGWNSPSQKAWASEGPRAGGVTVRPRSSSASKSERRTRRPTCRAGSVPWSIHYLNCRVMRTWGPGGLRGSVVDDDWVRIILDV